MSDRFVRLFGDSPARLLLRLVILSLVVGVVLAALGVEPYDIVTSALRFVDRIWSMGFDAVDRVWRYFLLGAVVVERVFALPGLGSMLLIGIEQRDYPNVQGVLFISTLIVLLVGFAADIVQRLVDPRLRDHAIGGRT